MTTITSEAYVELLRRRLESVETTAGAILAESKRHKWSKNMGVKDRDMLEKIQRDLGHIISYSSIHKIGGDYEERD